MADEIKDCAAVSGKSVKELLQDLEGRIRKLEQRMWMGMGALALLNFIRACI